MVCAVSPRTRQHPAAPGCDDGLHPSGPLASCQTPETDLALTRQLQGWTSSVFNNLISTLKKTLVFEIHFKPY